MTTSYFDYPFEIGLAEAKRVVEEIERHERVLLEILAAVERETPTDSESGFRGAVGKVIGEHSSHLLNRIYDLYPELIPEDLRS